jgi:hypothetical protein
MGAQGWHFDTWGIYEHGSLGAEFEVCGEIEGLEGSKA